MSLQMTYLATRNKDKIAALCQLLEKIEPTPQRAIAFLPTCHATAILDKSSPRGPAFEYVLRHQPPWTDAAEAARCRADQVRECGVADTSSHHRRRSPWPRHTSG